MLKSLKSLLVCLAFLPLAACAQDDAPYTEGEDYQLLAKPVATMSGDKIEVVELFWYGCPHCYALEPYVEDWQKTIPADVNFVRMPGVMAKSWQNHGRAYYTAAVLGIVDKTHRPLFDAIHRGGKSLNTQEELADFFADYGVDENKFNATFNSFTVNGLIAKAQAKQYEYRATGVPTLIVNGKYMVATTMNSGTRGLFDVVNYLIEKERNGS